MGVNSLPTTATRQRRDCDLNPGPSAPESSTATEPSAVNYLAVLGLAVADIQLVHTACNMLCTIMESEHD